MNETISLTSLYDKIQESFLEQVKHEVDANSENLKHEIQSQNPLLSVEQALQTKKNELLTLFKNFSDEVVKFRETIEVFCKYKVSYLSLEENKQFDKEILEFSNKFQYYLSKSKSNVKLQGQERKIDENATIQSILGISDFILYCFYTVGYHLMDQKLYLDASKIYTLLSALNPLIKDHWMALAMCEQEEKKYYQALNAYAMACILDFEDPMPHFASANCYVALRDFDNAEGELSMAAECIKRSNKPKAWNNYLEKLKLEIQRNKLRK